MMKSPLPNHSPFFIIEALKKIAKGIKNVWDRLKGKDEKQDEIAGQKGVDIQKIKAEEWAELERQLNEYRSNITSDADPIEHDMILECVDMLEDIMENLKEYNDKLKVVRIDSVKRKFSRVKKDLKGTFGEYIRKRISFDDPECMAALKLPAGDFKRKRLQELKEKAFVEAMEDIIDRVKCTVDDFLYEIDDIFSEHLGRAEEKLADKTEAFEKLCNVSDSDTQEKIMINAGFVIAMCDLAEENIKLSDELM